MDKTATKTYKGLHTDNSFGEQPQGTHRFGLNGVRNSERGDRDIVSNENSNEECYLLPEGFIPIGKEYMGNGSTALFLTKPGDPSPDIIAIVDIECNYTTHVRANLGFSLQHQIDAVFRLRRGCERTIYFTDNLNKPRIYNFDKPEDYKDINDNWEAEKFNLFKTYSSVPILGQVDILETGQIYSGSYNFSLQYLDEDLNPTEWILTTDTVIIYNDSITSKPFSEVRGSTNKKTFYQEFGVTNKAVKLNFQNLDKNFPFYRVAIIESNNGSGEVSRVVYSQEVSTQVPTYTYAGGNSFTLGTEEEIKQFNNIIQTAEHIEQIENKLILSNTKGKQIDYCKLQKYASRIKADLTKKTIKLNDITEKDNQKRSQLNLEDVGYMPGEIYSFGIVYLFSDGSTSPVYHIPGKNPNYNSQMSSDNILTDTFYTDNNNCNSDDYWGTDSQGNNLVNSLVRHHRFPLRKEIEEPLITQTVLSSGTNVIEREGLYLLIENDITSTEPTITYLVTYTINGVTETKIFEVVSNTYDSSVENKIFVDSSLDSISFTNVQELDPVDNTYKAPFSGLSYTPLVESISSSSSTTEDTQYSSEILGINFSGIDKPTLEDTGGEEVIGYHIVRNEKTEENKTILDSAVLVPLLKEVGDTTGEVKFVAHGHIFPETTLGRLEAEAYAIIHPEYKFNNKEYSNTTTIIPEGAFVKTSENKGERVLQDVQPGTSYDSSAHKRRERDTDGFSFHSLNRNSNVEYARYGTGSAPPVIDKTDINQIFYLNTLYSKSITDGNGDRKDIYNLSGDNKIGIVQFNTPKIPSVPFLQYVTMKRELGNPYGNFRVLPYYKETTNYSIFTQNIDNNQKIFNGDSYISPMKYSSSMYYDTKIKDRSRKSGVFNFILGVLSAIAGVVLIATGAGAAAGIALIGFGVSQFSTGLKQSQISRVYADLYDQGLKDTVEDDFTDAVFGPNPDDDTIQWFHETITNLWFESSVNMNWRTGATVGITDFMNSPTGYDEQSHLQYYIDKTTSPDSEADDGRTYQGFAKAEIYEVNKDYNRRDKQKVFFHLGLEYDCCSDCLEDFPHRVHWSEPSFQEELSDNYRTFLPNNYRDIEGQSGEITDMFKIKDNLYIHTEEALWHLPSTFQERVTGDIVSFIGTGSFFSIPPKQIIDDDNGLSAGNLHKWGTIKTPQGVFFVCEKEGVIYQFNGSNITPISSEGNFNWFKNNIKILGNKKYNIGSSKINAYVNNPSHPLGTGFISTYDSKNERILFTKKDYILKEGETLNNAWTMSYSLKSKSWEHYHSYLPSFYLHTPDDFYSWIPTTNYLWKHNKKYSYQNFYGERHPFIIEYVANNNPLSTKIWDYLKLITEAKKFNSDFNEFVEERFITFNKGLFYNSRQSSGVLNLMVKDTKSNGEDYLLEQVQSFEGDTIIVDRNEKDWALNNLRDIRVDYTQPMFNSRLEDLQDNYYIDKVVNENSIDYNKDWTQLESFRDKYLVVRLIFDNFDDIKLLLNYSFENEQETLR